jgi:L-ascorbate metabolism protein UlaG (beta-lactamase superfamily)
MKITYHGQSAFTFEGSKATLASDPQNQKTKTDVMLFTDSEKTPPDADSKIISWPGEYEVSGIVIVGKKVKNKNLSFYRFTIDEINIAFLNGIQEELDDEELNMLGEIDILVLAIGNTDFNIKKVHDIFEDIEPRILIPFAYTDQSLSELNKEFGNSSSSQKIQQFEITKETLPVDNSQIVILEEVTN